MVIAGNKSIALNPPVRRLSLTAGFAALSKAAQFAREILEKYKGLTEADISPEPLVFLKQLTDELDRARELKNEYLLTVRLMIARQLVISNRLGTAMPSGEYLAAAQQLIERSTSIIRSSDRYAWERLRELKSLISEGEGFSQYITDRTELTTHGSTVAVNTAQLLSTLSRTDIETGTVYAPKTELQYALFPTETLIFKALTAPPQPAPSEPSAPTVPTAQAGTTLPAEPAEAAAPAVSGETFNVTSVDTHYADSDTVILKNETDIQADNLQSATIENTANTTAFGDTYISKQPAPTVPGETVNVTSEDVHYNSGDALILKNETDIHTDNSQAISTTEQTANVTNYGDTYTSEQPSPAVSAETVNVTSEDVHYNSGDTIILKNETENHSDNSQLTTTQQTASVTNYGDTYTSEQPVPAVPAETVNVTSEDVHYNSGDTLILKNETDIHTDHSQAISTAEQTANVTNHGDTYTSEQPAPTVPGETVNVTSEDVHYNSGDTLILKNETENHTDNSQLTTTEHTVNVTNYGDTYTSEQPTPAVPGETVNVTSEDVHYNSGDTLILKNETENRTDNSQLTTAEQTANVTNYGDTYTSEQPAPTVHGEAVNVISEDVHYNSGDTLILKNETDIHTDNSQAISTAEHTANVTNYGDTYTSEQPVPTVPGETVNVTSEDVHYNSGDTLILKNETENHTDNSQLTTAEQTASVTNYGDIYISEQSVPAVPAETVNVTSEDVHYNSGDKLVLKNETENHTVNSLLTTAEHTANVTNYGDTYTSERPAPVVPGETVNVTSEDVRYNNGDTLILKNETENHTDNSQLTTAEHTANVTNYGDTYTSEQTAPAVLGETVNVTSEDVHYNSGDTLILKNETENHTDNSLLTTAKQTANVTNYGDTYTSEQPVPTVPGETVNVTSEDVHYNSGDTLILKNETENHTDNSQLTTAEQTANVTNYGDTYTSERPTPTVPGETVNVTSEGTHYAGADMVLRGEGSVVLNSFNGGGARYFAGLAGRRVMPRGVRVPLGSGRGRSRELPPPDGIAPVIRAAEKLAGAAAAAAQIATAEKLITSQSGLTETLFSETASETVMTLLERGESQPAAMLPEASSPAGDELKSEASTLLTRYLAGDIAAQSISILASQRQAASRGYAHPPAPENAVNPPSSAAVPGRDDTVVYRSEHTDSVNNETVNNRLNITSNSTWTLTGNVNNLNSKTEISSPVYRANVSDLVNKTNIIGPVSTVNVNSSSYTTEQVSQAYSEAVNNVLFRPGQAAADALDPGQSTAEVSGRESGMPSIPAPQYIYNIRAAGAFFPGAVTRSITVIPPAAKAVNTLSEPQMPGAAEPVRYRETSQQLSLHERPAAGHEPPEPARETSRRTAPATDMLIRQFGNLIDGADPTGAAADVGTVSVQGSQKALEELTAAIKTTAEQTAANSKVIDELKKKQSEIESEALKARDMRVISDEVITRLRTEMRFDRSRYSG